MTRLWPIVLALACNGNDRETTDPFMSGGGTLWGSPTETGEPADTGDTSDTSDSGEEGSS